MPLCRDPLVAQLNSMGFNALHVPRTDYVPTTLLVVASGHAPSLFGSLSDAFEAIHPPDPIVAAAGQFSGATTASYRTKMGLRLACDWLGLTPAQLSGALDGAKRMTFRFSDMRLMSVTLAALNKVLMAAEPAAALLTLAASRLFVISEALQAKQFLLFTEGESAKGVSISASAIDALPVQLGVSADVSKAGSGLVVFNAAQYHTIGFKAYEIEMAAGDFRLVPKGGTGLSHMTSGEDEYSPAVFDNFAP